jgi:hypothetical protein
VTAAGVARKAGWAVELLSDVGAVVAIHAIPGLPSRAISPQCGHHHADISIRRRSVAVNDRPLASLTALLALAVASVVTLMSTAALGACNTTLRGELVQDDRPNQRFRASPQKLLFFSLHEITEESGHKVEKVFWSYAFQNTEMTFPIPFALNIDSPRDCPKELELRVIGSHHSGFHYEYPMRGWKRSTSRKLNLRV